MRAKLKESEFRNFRLLKASNLVSSTRLRYKASEAHGKQGYLRATQAKETSSCCSKRAKLKASEAQREQCSKPE